MHQRRNDPHAGELRSVAPSEREPATTRFQAAGERGSFHEALRVLIDHSASMDLRRYEPKQQREQIKELPALVLAVLEEALGVLEAILSTYDGADSQHLSSSALQKAGEAPLSVRDSMLVEKEEAFEQDLLLQTAFIAQLELRQEKSVLLRAEAGLALEMVLSQCDGALGSARRALAVVDRALARFEDREPSSATEKDLRRAIAVRSACAKFRRRVIQGGEPSPESLYRRIREVGIHIAVLVGWPAYSLMQVGDRLLLQGLQERVIGWLRDGAGDVESGLQIWRDVTASVDVLMWNRRQELAQYDGGLLKQLRKAIVEGAPPGAAEITRLFDALRGLDDELDELMDRESTVEPSRYLQLIERLEARASRPDAAELLAR